MLQFKLTMPNVLSSILTNTIPIIIPVITIFITVAIAISLILLWFYKVKSKSKRNTKKISKPKLTVMIVFITIFWSLAGFIFYRTIGVNLFTDTYIELNSSHPQDKCPGIDSNTELSIEIPPKCVDSN